MRRIFAVAVLVVLSSPALAKWKVYGADLNYPSMSVDAKAPAHNINAYLRLECAPARSSSGLPLTLFLDQNVPKTGSVGWSIQIDGGETWNTPARRFLQTTRIELYELKGTSLEMLAAAKRLRLTLKPNVGGELTYDFDVSGGAAGIEKMACR
jgi:hypothetical protein